MYKEDIKSLASPIIDAVEDIQVVAFKSYLLVNVVEGESNNPSNDNSWRKKFSLILYLTFFRG